MKSRKFFREGFINHFKLLFLAALVGILGGFGAILFRKLIQFFQDLFWGKYDNLLTAAITKPGYIVIVITSLGGLVVGLVIYFGAREAKGHGVPEVMEAVLLKGGIIRKKVSVVKALASSLCIATGGSVGREGPIVQIGSSLASTVGQLFKLKEREMKTLVGAGVAAGIAGTFNAPIAGAIFAVEIVLGEFSVTCFGPIVISSVLSTHVSHSFVGDFAAFKVPEYTLTSSWEIGPYMILGFVAGLIGLAFIKTLYFSEQKWDKLRIPEYVKPAIGGLIIGFIALQFPHILGVGYENIDLSLYNKIPFFLAFGLIFIKLFATSITLGSGGSGGVFAPSLFMGAMTGNFIGKIFYSFFPASISSPGAYALVGMGAIVAATTHAPITAIIIIFELTGDYQIILPLMLTCIISSFITIGLQKESIYTLKLKHRGISFKEGKEINILRSLLVKNFISQDYTTFYEGKHIGEIIDNAINKKHSTFHILANDGTLYGVITLNHLKSIIHQKDLVDSIIIAGDVAIPDIKLNYNDNLEKAMDIFGKSNLDEIPVVNKENRLVGVIKRRDLIEAYNNEILRRETVQGLINKLKFTHDSESINLGRGYIIREVEAPENFWGKNLKDLNLKAEYKIEIVLIKKKYPPTTIPLPAASNIIEKGDILILAGPQENLDKLF